MAWEVGSQWWVMVTEGPAGTRRRTYLGCLQGLGLEAQENRSVEIGREGSERGICVDLVIGGI